ncbi:unnamed protein product [Camellia sinensis]
MASKRHLQSLFNRICRESRIIKSFGALSEKTMPSSSQHLINLEYECSAHKGSSIWDPEGNKYLDFLSAYSAVNQGR